MQHMLSNNVDRVNLWEYQLPELISQNIAENNEFHTKNSLEMSYDNLILYI